MNPSLALCMIVRNEESHLARCLASVRDAVDAIYITDTGSTDGTVEIARRFGATLRHFEWCDDFSAARNHAIAGVREDWILCLDADDWFPPGEAAKIRPLLAAADSAAFTVRYHIMDGHTPVPGLKVFKNGLGLRYEGIIHENLRNSLAAVPGARTGRLDVTLQHAGYTTTSLEEKLGRNLPLLEREWTRCCAATDHKQRLYVGKELACALIRVGREREGEELLLRLLDEPSKSEAGPQSGDGEIAVLATLLWFYHSGGRNDEALAACRRFENWFSRHFQESGDKSSERPPYPVPLPLGGGEGARRAGEGDSYEFMAVEQVRQEHRASHRPSSSGRESAQDAAGAKQGGLPSVTMNERPPQLDARFAGAWSLFRLYRGLSLFRTRRFAAALADLDAFEAHCRNNELEFSVPEAYTNVELWDMQGQCHLALEMPAAAAGCFRRCRQHSPASDEYRVKLHLAESRAVHERSA